MIADIGIRDPADPGSPGKCTIPISARRPARPPVFAAPIRRFAIRSIMCRAQEKSDGALQSAPPPASSTESLPGYFFMPGINFFAASSAAPFISSMFMCMASRYFAGSASNFALHLSQQK